MKNLSLLTLLFIFGLCSCLPGERCPENINTLPLYGHAKKCQGQIEADKEFIAECDKTFPNRDSAYRHHIKSGWQYLEEDTLTSMKRFNEAWLLDSTKAEVYWGIGALLGREGKFKESIDFFEKALSLKKLDESPLLNGNLLRDASISYGNYFFETKNKQYLDKSIEYLRKSLVYNADNPLAYHDLAVDYYYYSQNDSAKKYMAITDKYNAKLIPQELRDSINRQASH